MPFQPFTRAPTFSRLFCIRALGTAVTRVCERGAINAAAPVAHKRPVSRLFDIKVPMQKHTNVTI